MAAELADVLEEAQDTWLQPREEGGSGSGGGGTSRNEVTGQDPGGPWVSASALAERPPPWRHHGPQRAPFRTNHSWRTKSWGGLRGTNINFVASPHHARLEALISLSWSHNPHKDQRDLNRLQGLFPT